jgi:cytochrome P450
MHRDKTLWQEAEMFKPERFAPENEAHLPENAYLPFGGGPRICIGNSFALMEAQLLLATMAQQYRLTLAPGQKVDMQPMITLNPKGGLPMTIQRRQPHLEPEIAAALLV